MSDHSEQGQTDRDMMGYLDHDIVEGMYKLADLERRTYPDADTIGRECGCTFTTPAGNARLAEDLHEEPGTTVDPATAIQARNAARIRHGWPWLEPETQPEPVYDLRNPDGSHVGDPEPFCEMTGPMPSDERELFNSSSLNKLSGIYHANLVRTAEQQAGYHWAMIEARNVVNVRTMVMLRRCKTEAERSAMNDLCEDILEALRSMPNG